MENDFTDAEESTRPKLKRIKPSTIRPRREKLLPDEQLEVEPKVRRSNPKTDRCRPVDTIKTLSEPNNPPLDLMEGKTPPEQEIIRDNWVSMKHYSRSCRIQSIYNIRLIEDEDFTPHLESIFSAQLRTFKISASVGLVVRHNTTKRLRLTT